MKISIDRCPTCRGTGAYPGSDNVNWLPCPKCHGRKVIGRETILCHCGAEADGEYGGQLMCKSCLDEREQAEPPPHGQHIVLETEPATWKQT